MLNFHGFARSTNFLLTDDSYNIYMDECLERECLVYYEVSGEPGITGCSRQSDIYLGGCGRVHTYSLIITAYELFVFVFSRVKFSQLVSTTVLTVKFSRSTVPLYRCTDVYTISTRYTSAPAFCCTLHECLLQEACKLASNMVDFSKMEMNDLLNDQDS